METTRDALDSTGLAPPEAQQVFNTNTVWAMTPEAHRESAEQCRLLQRSKAVTFPACSADAAMRCLLPRSARPAAIALLATVSLVGFWPSPQAMANETPQADALAAIREVWPGEHMVNAIRVAYLESGLTPTARGCDGDCIGLFQIHYT
ncbi:MAG: hypothetical protein ACRC1L_07955, partial [Prochlorococcaceae cyanobacterium]